jgi:FixJ family two-component response regulator
MVAGRHLLAVSWAQGIANGAPYMRDTVCIVDNDEEMRVLLARVVQSVGLPTRSYDSAESFLDRQPEAGVACLLIDVELGGMSGVSLLERLAEHELDVPVFLISGGHDAHTIATAKRLGAVAVDKPFDARGLAQQIRAAVKEATKRPTND